MSCYETIIIFQPELSEEDLERNVEAVREKLASGGAEISECEHWGKRRLAYKVRRERYGTYVLFRYEAPATAVRDTESQLGITEPVLKYLTVRCRPGQTTPAELLRGERGEREERPGGRDRDFSGRAPARAAEAPPSPKPEPAGDENGTAEKAASESPAEAEAPAPEKPPEA